MEQLISKKWLCLVACLSLCTFGCTGAQTKKGGVVKKAVKQVKIAGCIRGRVVNESGNGFMSVVVKTNPPTSPQVTNMKGFFEICYKQQLIDADMGESKKVSLPIGTYTLNVVKEGYHARPVTFAYKGSKTRVDDIVMVEKTRPLPQVTKTQLKEQKRTSGLGGKSPIGE